MMNILIPLAHHHSNRLCLADPIYHDRRMKTIQFSSDPETGLHLKQISKRAIYVHGPQNLHNWLVLVWGLDLIQVIRWIICRM